MLKQRVYNLVGPPYSGKTTLRNKLIEKFGFKYISIDDAVLKRGLVVETMKYSDWSSVYRDTYEELRKLLNEGKSVIVDIGNLKRKEREDISRISKEMGIECIQIYINTPIEVIQERRIKNLKTKKRRHVKDVTFERALGMFEEPDSSENCVIYNEHINFDDWVREKLC